MIDLGEMARRLSIEWSHTARNRSSHVFMDGTTEASRAIVEEILATLEKVREEGVQKGLALCSENWEGGRRSGLEEAEWIRAAIASAEEGEK